MLTFTMAKERTRDGSLHIAGDGVPGHASPPTLFAVCPGLDTSTVDHLPDMVHAHCDDYPTLPIACWNYISENNTLTPVMADATIGCHPSRHMTAKDTDAKNNYALDLAVHPHDRPINEHR